MGRQVYKTLIAALCCLVVACKKDKPPTVANTAPTGSGYLYIVCEGEYPSGDAALYALQPATNTLYGDLYQAANGQKLGDVFQSMVRINNQFFLSVNNSNKIAVIDATTYKLIANIAIPLPRYILPISNTKAYVSSLFHNKVYIINTQTYTVTDSILFPYKNTEGMCSYNGDAFICTWDTAGNKIFRVDGTTDKITQTITVAGYAPQELLLDKDQLLWVLAGDEPEKRNATLTRIDPSTGSIVASYNFPSNADPLKPAFNPTKDTLYFLEDNYDIGPAANGVYRMGINDAALPTQPFIAAQSLQYYYALGIDPLSGSIYIGDPIGFGQKGAVYIYKQDGTQTDSLKVGSGPGHFYFDY